MITELLNSLHSDIAMGMAQAAGAIVLCAAELRGRCRQHPLRCNAETGLLAPLALRSGGQRQWH